MADAPKLGEPIPLGIVTRDTAVLGDETIHENTTAVGDGTQSVGDQIAALKEEIAALKLRLADAGKSASAAVEAHPLITATIVSLGAWALVAMVYRRSQVSVTGVYPSIRDRIDQWR
ncbi:hypothetical protein [Pararhizobium antarcticum]|uniref:Uncharacterized protein n=1 Tax=Pararhizobium antarcticum TaxID=1798805 RepID=A0A657LSL5_9HYPH|nr:hypothetical protein [Pararhizobium antarcticum]OJF89897.1 hypothetical protein AX761_24005 [Rhizobium sp. 58]OJF92834.1 hypothetical protein AX760_22045 [Pararhizobium antarcticum]